MIILTLLSVALAVSTEAANTDFIFWSNWDTNNPPWQPSEIHRFGNLKQLKRSRKEVVERRDILQKELQDVENKIKPLDAKIKAVTDYYQSRFKSALGEDVTTLVLQQAMYGSEARKTLAADPTLAHIYHDHARGFVEEFPGVEVTGAGDETVNGWYARKEAAEGPPAAWTLGQEFWTRRRSQWSPGYHQYFYEKDDDHYLYDYVSILGKRYWHIVAPDGSMTPYYNEVPTNDDPAPEQGWKVNYRERAPGQYGPRYYSPAPTLRMVA